MTYGYNRFILAFISEIPALLEHIPEAAHIAGVTVEFVPLLLDLRGPPQLDEYGKGGKLIEFYEQGSLLSSGAGNVERMIKRSSP